MLWRKNNTYLTEWLWGWNVEHHFLWVIPVEAQLYISNLGWHPTWRNSLADREEINTSGFCSVFLQDMSKENWGQVKFYKTSSKSSVLSLPLWNLHADDDDHDDSLTLNDVLGTSVLHALTHPNCYPCSLGAEPFLTILSLSNTPDSLFLYFSCPCYCCVSPSLFSYS